MIRVLFVSIFISFTLLEAIVTIRPTYSIKATGSVQDIVYAKHKLYAATDKGTVEVFNTKNKKRIKKIQIPTIKDFMGDDISAKIYSVDIDHNDITFVSQGNSGYREVWLYRGKKLTKLIGIDKMLLARKVRFLESNKILIGLLSNQILLYDIKAKKFIFDIQVNSSSFADFVLSEDKKQLYSTDESGAITQLDAHTGKQIRVVGEKNLDKVYQIDYKHGVLLTAGQDRKSVVYEGKSSYEFDFSFLLYSCGLSPSANYGAIAYNEDNDILVFDMLTKDKRYNLVGQDSTLTKIIFISDKELFSSSDSKTINFWKLK